MFFGYRNANKTPASTEGVHDLSNSGLDIVTEVHHNVVAGLSTFTTKRLYLVLH